MIVKLNTDVDIKNWLGEHGLYDSVDFWKAYKYFSTLGPAGCYAIAGCDGLTLVKRFESCRYRMDFEFVDNGIGSIKDIRQKGAIEFRDRPKA
jgi:hypothetical protein